MSVINTTYRCDWPGCGKTITISRRNELSDNNWEGRRYTNFSPRYHVCDGHRFKSSDELEEALAPNEAQI